MDHLWVVRPVSARPPLYSSWCDGTDSHSHSVAASLALFLPRAPSFSSNPNAPLTARQGSNVPNSSFSTGPLANFTFPATLDLEMSTGGNIIPIHMNNVHAEIYLIDTNKPVATGNTGGFTRAPGKTQQLNIDIMFDYSADNSTDQTCKWSPLLSRVS